MTRTALVVGASGLVGRALVAQLLADVRWSKVIVLVRRPLSITDPKLDSRQVDFDALVGDATLALPPVDDAFCALGTTIRTAGSQEAFERVDFDYAFASAHVARRAGATCFVFVSALGADAASRVFYSRVKGELEAAIAAMDWPRWYALRPSFLIGDRSESRPGERLGIAAATLFSPLLLGGLRKYRPIAAAQVARAMVALATGRRTSGPVESDEIAGL